MNNVFWLAMWSIWAAIAYRTIIVLKYTAEDYENAKILKAKALWYLAMRFHCRFVCRVAHRWAERCRARGGTIGANTITWVDCENNRDSSNSWAYSPSLIGKTVFPEFRGPTNYPELDR